MTQLDKDVYRVYNLHMDENIKREVIEKYALLIEKASRNSNVSRNFGTDVDIYRSEIHIIGVIGNQNDVHISEIARKFGVTKGAVSKIMKKLEKKGLVEKIVDDENQTRVLVRLTEKGWLAHREHEAYHAEYDSDMFSYLDNLSEEALNVLDTFLEKANKMADKHL